MADVTVQTHVDTFMRSATASAARDALGIQSGATYSTVAEMVAADVTNITSGQTVTLTGYYAAGDFGEPLQLTVEASTGGVKSHTLADGRYANLYANGPLNVKWFGAKGDGSKPNGVASTGSDDRSAIQDCINYANSQNASSRIVYFPSGYYHIKSSITVNGKVVGLCFGWKNAYNGDPTSAVTTGTEDSVQGLRMVGEGNFPHVGVGNNAQGSVIVYSGSSNIDAVCYVAEGSVGYTGIENMAIAGDEFGTLDSKNLIAGRYDDDGSDIFNGEIWGTEFKADHCYLVDGSEYKPFRDYKNIYLSASKLCNGDFGSGYVINLSGVQANACLGTGIKIDAATSLRVDDCWVRNYFLKAYHLSGSLFYSRLKNCLADQWIAPDNPLFDPYGSTPSAADGTKRPWHHKPTYYWEDYDADADVGTMYYIEGNSGQITIENPGSEGFRRAVVLTGNRQVNVIHPDWVIGAGSRLFFQTKGQLTGGFTGPAKLGSVNFNSLDFNPSTDLADDDFVFIGKRTGIDKAGWDAKYSSGDNFTTWGDQSTQIYGYVFRVTSRTASSFTATRMGGVGNFFDFQGDASVWPSGTTNFVTGDYVAKINKDALGVLKVPGGTGDTGTNSCTISISGGKIGGEGNTDISVNTRTCDNLVEGATAFDRIFINETHFTKVYESGNDSPKYYEARVEDLEASYFGSADVHPRATASETAGGQGKAKLITPYDLKMMAFMPKLSLGYSTQSGRVATGSGAAITDTGDLLTRWQSGTVASNSAVARYGNNSSYSINRFGTGTFDEVLTLFRIWPVAYPDSNGNWIFRVTGASDEGNSDLTVAGAAIKILTGGQIDIQYHNTTVQTVTNVGNAGVVGSGNVINLAISMKANSVEFYLNGGSLGSYPLGFTFTNEVLPSVGVFNGTDTVSNECYTWPIEVNHFKAY